MIDLRIRIKQRVVSRRPAFSFNIAGRYVEHATGNWRIAHIAGIIALQISLLFSCQQKESDSLLKSFKQSSSLSHSVVEKDSFWKVNNIIKNGKYIILHEEDGSTNLSIYDLNKKQIVNRFAKKGNGPNEILSPPLSINILSEDRILWLDQNRRMIYEVDYSQNNPSLVKKLDLKEKKDYLFNVLLLKNNYYTGIGFIEEGRYLVLDSIGNKKATWFEYPQDDQNTDFTHKAMAYQGGLVAHPDKSRFFFYCYDSEILEILKIKEDGGLVKEKKIHFDYVSYVPQKDGKAISSAIRRESKVCFISAGATNDYIYLLYSGRVIGEDIYAAHRSNTVLVYDWDGNPVIRYDLDMDVNFMTVDEDDKGIYGFSNDPEPMLVYFDLSK